MRNPRGLARAAANLAGRGAPDSGRVGRVLYRGLLRAAGKFEQSGAGAIGLDGLAERCLRANALHDLLAQFPEEWEWEHCIEQADLLQAQLKGRSATEAVRGEFRGGSGQLGLDDGLRAMVSMQELANLVEVAHEVMRPQPRPDSIQYKVGEVLSHAGYGWEAVILGYDERCRMDQSWVAENAAPADQARVPQLYEAPWYDLLCDDGVVRYGSQLSHQRATGPITMSQEGTLIMDMLFDGWDEANSRYVANQDLAERFPDQSNDEIEAEV